MKPYSRSFRRDLFKPIEVNPNSTRKAVASTPRSFRLSIASNTLYSRSSNFGNSINCFVNFIRFIRATREHRAHLKWLSNSCTRRSPHSGQCNSGSITSISFILYSRVCCIETDGINLFRRSQHISSASRIGGIRGSQTRIYPILFIGFSHSYHEKQPLFEGTPILE